MYNCKYCYYKEPCIDCIKLKENHEMYEQEHEFLLNQQKENTMNNFLPKGYEKLKTNKSYWKLSEMNDGDNKLRIVMQPIGGWIDWDDKKPLRFTPENKPKKPINPEKPIKAFWACYVWDYAREGLYILEITQSSILKALMLFAKDEDWGDFTKYDLKFNKLGSGKETRYALTPLPHKPLSPKIEEALKASPVRLEALYHGGDPWTDLDATIDEGTGEVMGTVESMSSIEKLKEHLEIDGMELGHLDEYLQDLAAKKKVEVDHLINSALIPELYEKFKKTYQAFLQRLSGEETQVAY